MAPSVQRRRTRARSLLGARCSPRRVLDGGASARALPLPSTAPPLGVPLSLQRSMVSCPAPPV